MPKHPRLQCRNGTYYFRAKTPADISDSYGKQEETFSLRTKDPKEALRLVRIEAVRIDEKFEAHRQSHGTGRACAAAKRPAITIASVTSSRHRQSVIDAEFARRAETKRQVDADVDGFIAGGFVDHPRDERYYFLTQEGTWQDLLRYCFKVETKSRIDFLQRSISIGDCEAFLNMAGGNYAFARDLMLAEVEALETFLRNEPVARHEIDAEVIECPLISEAVANWVAEQSRDAWTEETRQSSEITLRDFIEIVGNKPIADYAKSDAREYKAVMLDLPPNLAKRRAFHGLSLREAAKKAKSEGLQTMRAKTVNKRIQTVSAFFNWACNHYDHLESNPLAGLAVKITNGTRNERDPFSIHELNTIFRSPIYTGCASETHWKQPGDLVQKQSAKYWVPLIALFSGMRLGEIIQLRTDDIKTSADVFYFDIAPGGDKSVKTDSSKRKIPLHPMLKHVGFLDFVSDRKRQKSERLFPDYRRTSAKLSWSDAFSKHFRKFLEALKIKQSANCFHSFRHSFEDACRNSSVPADLMDALQGHAQQATLVVTRIDRLARSLRDLQNIVHDLKGRGVTLKGKSSALYVAHQSPAQATTVF
ncbi:MAG: tyrosine-type recombinase/integrase [Alphaproteobacteria bacterium]|nr:tyrosine-type recombinase/integrase [Alphaproteobacteria bacterium]